MSKQTNAELIAEAREAAKRADWYMTGESPLLRALADALEAAEQERDEARKAAEDHVLDADAVHVRLSAELREVNQERDQLAAVVEEVRAWTMNASIGPSGTVQGYMQAQQDALGILASTPTDALREHDAKVRAEALREAAEDLNNEFQDIPAWLEAHREGVRTNEWMVGGARMVLSAVEVLRDRADRIEREADQ